MFWSNYFFYTCYHAGGSSPSDALTPKKRKTRWQVK